jgi:hypothetical protein
MDCQISIDNTLVQICRSNGCLCSTQSTYIAPQCMSPSRNWDSPNPFPASECALPADQRVGPGAHSPVAAKGVGEFQFRRLEKKLSTLHNLWCSMSSESLLMEMVEQSYQMLCLPLYSILLALGNPTVNYFR